MWPSLLAVGMPAAGPGSCVGVQGTVRERVKVSQTVCPGRMTQCEGAGGGGVWRGCQEAPRRCAREAGSSPGPEPPAVPAPGPARSPRRPSSPDADARARRMRGAGCRVRGAARWPGDQG